MQRKIVRSGDGSPTLFVPELDEHYHSIHGAIQESMHVFIQHGLRALDDIPTIRLLEIGFGTGLNALLTLAHKKVAVEYTAVEAYPLNIEETAQLDYTRQIDRPDLQDNFQLMHACEWEKPCEIAPGFSLTKTLQKIEALELDEKFDLIYFDAFAPSAQPQLWTDAIFQNMYDSLVPNGCLVTYCAKGSVKRSMKAVGFTVEALSGPPGKREMTKATKH